MLLLTNASLANIQSTQSTHVHTTQPGPSLWPAPGAQSMPSLDSPTTLPPTQIAGLWDGLGVPRDSRSSSTTSTAYPLAVSG